MIHILRIYLCLANLRVLNDTQVFKLFLSFTGLYDDAHQKLVRLEKGAETSAAEESRTKVPPKRKRRISQTKIQNKSSDEEGEDADMECDSDDGYPKLVLVSK